MNFRFFDRPQPVPEREAARDNEVVGLGAVMKLFEREPDEQPTNHVLRAPMMALSQPDRGLGFPSGTVLIPRIFLRNAASSSTRVSLTVDWRSEDKSGEFAPPPLTLSPGEVRVISLASQQKSGQIPADATWATVKLGYMGKTADLIPVAISYDKGSRYGLQTPFSETLGRMWAGGMWHVDSTHTTFIATGNGGSEPTTAEATLFYNGGKDKYRVEKKLAPGEQLWLDVGKVLRDQVPDSEGHTLPPGTMTGSYELRDLDHGYVGQLYEGKLVIDKTYGHAAYGCASCCQYSVPFYDIDPLTGPQDDGFIETIDSTDSCGGALVDVTGGAYDWASSNTAVATLSSPTLYTVAPGSATGSASVQLQHGHILPDGDCPTPVFGPTQTITVQPTVTISGPTNIPMLLAGTQGIDSITVTATGTPSGGTYSWTAVSGGSNITILDATSQSAILQSVAVGTYTVQVTYTVNNQIGTATPVGRVQQPGSLGVISNTTPTFNCGNTGLPAYNTTDRLIQYQVLDTSGSPIPAAGMDASETTLNVISNTCNVNGPNPAINSPTLSDGYFQGPDSLQLCSAQCLPAGQNGVPLGSCTMKVAQTWSVNGYAVKSDTLTYTCPGPPTGAP